MCVGDLDDVIEILSLAEQARRAVLTLALPPPPPPAKPPALSGDVGAPSRVDAARKAALATALAAHVVQHHHKWYEKLSVLFMPQKRWYD